MTLKRGIIGVLLAAVLIAPACGLGDKQAQGTVIRQAFDKARAAKGANAILSIEYEPGDRPEPTGGQALAAVIDATTTTLPKKESLPPELQPIYDKLVGLRPRLIVDAKVALDFTNDRAKVTFVPELKQGGFDVDGNIIEIPGRGPYVFPFVPSSQREAQEAAAAAAAAGAQPPAEGALPTAPAAGDAQATTSTTAPGLSAAELGTELTSIWANHTSYLRRAETRPREKRVWAKLDWSTIDEEEQVPSPVQMQLHPTMINLVNTINPLYILELAVGTLTGSIEVAGKEQVAGVQTTRYDVRIAPEQVAEELDFADDETALRSLMFRLLRVGGGDVIDNASIWIDNQGRLRKVRVELNQVYRRDFDNIVVISLELPELGVPVDIPVPKAEETIEVERYGRLLRAGVPRGLT